MKKLLPFIFLLASYTTFAQVDSSEIKLLQYKQWLDKGLIDKPEYDQLKSKILRKELAEPVKQPVAPSEPVAQPPVPQKVEDKPSPAQQLANDIINPGPGLFEQIIADHPPGQRMHKADTMDLSKLKGRSLAGLIAGPIFIGGGAASFAALQSNLSFANQISFTVLGSGLIVVGIVATVLGAKDRRVYLRRKNSELSFSPSPSGLGLAMKF